MDAMYGMLSDPESRQMAPFFRLAYVDRPSFEAEVAAMMADPTRMLFSMVASGHFVGACMTFSSELGRELFYWMRRIAWGRGLATEGIVRLLKLDHTRPMYARVVATNDRALAVLRTCGFVEESRALLAPVEGEEPVTELVYVRR